MRVLVTGGNGLIGSRVVRLLCRADHEVTCLLRPGARTERIAGLCCNHVQGDILDNAALQRALSGCQAVVHLACPSAWSEIESPGIGDVVVQGLRNVLDGADDETRIVFVSSLAALGPAARTERLTETPLRPPRKRPGMAYAYAKMCAEDLCREASAQGRDVVIVNPAETYGPDDDRLVTAGNLIGLLQPPLTLVCSGGTCIAHVDDVAEGIVAALERGKAGERYILGGENLHHAELARLVLAIAGRRQPIVTVPNFLFRWATRAATALGIALPYDRCIVPYATRYWFADNSKASRDLNVRFRPARETLEPTLDWLKQAGYVQ